MLETLYLLIAVWIFLLGLYIFLLVKLFFACDFNYFTFKTFFCYVYFSFLSIFFAFACIIFDTKVTPYRSTFHKIAIFVSDISYNTVKASILTRLAGTILLKYHDFTYCVDWLGIRAWTYKFINDSIFALIYFIAWVWQTTK